jgi:uncharacterized protein (UPF0335 family)
MSKPGHNSKTQPATVAGQKIKSYVDRVEKLEEDRKAIGGDIRDVYAEAKGNGYDVKTLRWLVQERRVQAVDRDERDALRDTYKHALDMAVHLVQVEGLSLREAAKRTGTNKSSVHRALAVPHVSQEPKPEDSNDGITDAAPQRCVDGGSALAVADTPTAVPPPATPQPAPEGGVGTGATFSRLETVGHDVDPVCAQTAHTGNEAPATPSVGAVASESERVAHHDHDDDLRVPDFLRGSRRQTEAGV